MKTWRFYAFPSVIVALALTTSACAHQPEPSVYNPPGFWSGLLHGYLILLSFFGSWFSDVRIYAFPNGGFWYDFGFVLGAGASFTAVEEISRSAVGDKSGATERIGKTVKGRDTGTSNVAVVSNGVRPRPRQRLSNRLSALVYSGDYAKSVLVKKALEGHSIEVALEGPAVSAKGGPECYLYVAQCDVERGRSLVELLCSRIT
jgi:hypothetical protein